LGGLRASIEYRNKPFETGDEKDENLEPNGGESGEPASKMKRRRLVISRNVLGDKGSRKKAMGR